MKRAFVSMCKMQQNEQLTSEVFTGFSSEISNELSGELLGDSLVNSQVHSSQVKCVYERSEKCLSKSG